MLFQRWTGKQRLIRRAIEEEQEKNHGKVVAELAEKYMQSIFEKNRQAVEIARVKEEIETQIASVGFGKASDSDEVARMQGELDDLLGQYEKLVGDKLHLFAAMLESLREIGRTNESVICAEEEIARLKNNMDFVRRDALQKKRMLDDHKKLINELKQEMCDIDEELGARDARISQLQDQVRNKDGELQDLEDLILHKDRIIEQMQIEIVEVEEQRKRDHEERKKKDLEDAIQKANQPRKPYVAVRGDPIDEMMTKYINECPYFVPVERLAEGNYLFGNKKVFAKIMNGKLIIRVGGGYMVIEEFLKHFELEMSTPKEKTLEVDSKEEALIEPASLQIENDY